MKNVIAYYSNTISNMEMMDKAARHAVATFGPKEIGAGTFLPTMERDLQWHIADDKAAAARQALEKIGFRVKVTDV